MNADTNAVIKTSRKMDEKHTRTNVKTSERSKDLIESFVGKDVMVVFKSKNKLKGRVDAVSTYELMLTVSQRSVLVMKHAIDYIETVDMVSQK